jgi:hypothetical protein
MLEALVSLFEQASPLQPTEELKIQGMGDDRQSRQ